MATFCTCSTLFCTFLCCCFARLQRETSRNILDPVHTYPYSNRICPDTCIRIRHGFTLVPREYRQQSMCRGRHLEYSIHGKELGLLKSFFSKRTYNIQGWTMQPLKTFKPFELTWPLRKQPSNSWMLLARLQKNLRIFCFQKPLWLDNISSAPVRVVSL